jgi:hypothetical protein
MERTAAILLADPQDSFDYAVKLLARHGLLVLISQPAEGITLNFMYVTPTPIHHVPLSRP